ncbi:MAG TPA: TerB family tellurite resistance protein [Kofleriaceae bacterium]
MTATDRILPLCDVLLGAAYADAQFVDREREEIREMLADLAGGKLAPEVEKRIETFDPEGFDLAKAVAAFKGDDADDRRRLLFLVAALNDADDELDLAEDDYLRALAAALDLPASALDGLALEVEIEELRQDFARVRKLPPPLPGKKIEFDIDID